MDRDRKISKPRNILFVFILFGIIAILSSINGLADTGSVNVTLDAGAYNITKDASGYDVIVMDGFSDRVETGDPMLPQKTFDVLLPPNYEESSLQLKIVSAKSEVLTGTYDLKPSPEWLPQNSNDTVIEAANNITTGIPLGIETAIPSEKVIKTSTYETDADYPENYVYLLPNSQMRKWMFVPVNFIPFQYNPVTKKLIFHENVTIEISFAEKELSLSAEESLSDTVFDDAAPDKFINYNEASAWYGPGEKAKLKSSAVSGYVIVTTNAIKNGSSKLNTFVAHKQALGYSVQVVTESDYDGLTGQAPNLRAEKIRQWLKNNYLSKGIKYVLLVGDPTPYENGGNDIPMKMCWPRLSSSSYRESPTDYFYADLTGNWDINGNGYYGESSDYQTSGGVDLTADVYVGRIPVYGANYAALDSILQKVINYETQSSTSWRKSALLPMSFSDSSTDGGYLGESMKNAYLVPNGYSYWRIYQHGTYGSCNINSAFASEETLTGGSTVPNRWANNDFGIICWWGHGNSQGAYVSYSPCGSSSFMLSSYAPSLDDAHPTHTYQCSCLNGQPEDSSNLQYAILKNGGITTTSATRVSWYYVGQTSYAGSPSNAGMGYEYVKRLVQEMPAGEALYRMKSSGVYQPGSSAEVLMNFYVMCLDGDPSVGIMNHISAPAVTNSDGATAITTSSARLNGEVNSTGGENPTVHIYWGDNDGGVTSTNWDNDVNLGTLPVGTFYRDLSGLTPGKTYYYRCYASNSAGGSWAESTNMFTAKSIVVALVRGKDGTLWTKNWDESTWSSWQNLGSWTDLLAATSSGSNVFIFGRGRDGLLWTRNWDGSTWSSWQNLSSWIDLLAATSSGSNVFVFGRGGDGALWTMKWNGSTWDSWQSLGSWIDLLAATSSGSNVFVFGRGKDGSLWTRKWDGSTWGSWQSLGGWIDLLAATSSGSNVFEFGRGKDGALWTRKWDGSTWGSWQSLGGWLDLLAATSSGSNVFVFGRGRDGAIWTRKWDGSTWGSWQSLGGWIDLLDATSSGSNVFVFGRGRDGALWNIKWDGSTWSSSQNLGGWIDLLDAASIH